MGGDKLMAKKPRYLALGDSYTIGEAVDFSGNFPYQLSKKMEWESPKILAKTGWTTRNLMEAIQSENLNPEYDFVSLLIGVNNQYQGKSRKIYVKELEKLIAFGLSKVDNSKNFILLSIPNYGITPFGENWSSYITSELIWYNEQIKEAAAKYHLTYVDIYDISLLAEKNLSLLAKDMLHPSAEMYGLWVEKIIQIITN